MNKSTVASTEILTATTDDESTSTRPAYPSPRPKQNECSVCLHTKTKHECIECRQRFCSLDCKKQHKRSTPCSGHQMPFVRLQLSDMTDEILCQDFRFLEDVRAKVEKGFRNTSLHHLEYEAKQLKRGRGRGRGGGSHNTTTLHPRVDRSTDYSLDHPYRIPDYSYSHTLFSRPAVELFRSDLPPALKRLRHEAKMRGTHLHFMPRNMSHHNANMSYYMPRLKTIRWFVRVEFVQCDLYFEQIFDERTSVGRIVSTFLREAPEGLKCFSSSVFRDPATNCVSAASSRDPTNLCDEDATPKLVADITPATTASDVEAVPLTEHQAQEMLYYQAAGMGNIAVIFKNVDFRYNVARYEMLDSSDSLRENLVGLSVVEYPTLLVFRKDHAYELLNREYTIEVSDMSQEIKRDLPESNNNETSENNFKYFDADCDYDD